MLRSAFPLPNSRGLKLSSANMEEIDSPSSSVGVGLPAFVFVSGWGGVGSGGVRVGFAAGELEDGLLGEANSELGSVGLWASIVFGGAASGWAVLVSVSSGTGGVVNSDLFTSGRFCGASLSFAMAVGLVPTMRMNTTNKPTAKREPVMPMVAMINTCRRLAVSVLCEDCL